jgi:hypothetical protein
MDYRAWLKMGVVWMVMVFFVASSIHAPAPEKVLTSEEKHQAAEKKYDESYLAAKNRDENLNKFVQEYRKENSEKWRLRHEREAKMDAEYAAKKRAEAEGDSTSAPVRPAAPEPAPPAVSWWQKTRDWFGGLLHKAPAVAPSAVPGAVTVPIVSVAVSPAPVVSTPPAPVEAVPAIVSSPAPAPAETTHVVANKPASAPARGTARDTRELDDLNNKLDKILEN